MRLMDMIHAKLELYRLEKRYTKSRQRRSTFVSGATYVDGEYVYQESKWDGPKKNSTGGSGTSTASTNATEMSDTLSKQERAVRASRMSRISIREMKWESSRG